MYLYSVLVELNFNLIYMSHLICETIQGHIRILKMLLHLQALHEPLTSNFHGINGAIHIAIYLNVALLNY